MPALIDACRAGAWPWPAGSTLPMITSSTSVGAMPARSTAALIATAPRSLAVSDAKSPMKPPIGVLAAPTMTIGSFSMIRFLSFGGGPRQPARPRDELAAAVRAAAGHRVGAARAERALVAADARVGRRGRQRRRHFSHAGFNSSAIHFVSLKSSRPISIRRISEVPAPIS